MRVGAVDSSSSGGSVVTRESVLRGGGDWERRMTKFGLKMESSSSDAMEYDVVYVLLWMPSSVKRERSVGGWWIEVGWTVDSGQRVDERGRKPRAPPWFGCSMCCTFNCGI